MSQEFTEEQTVKKYMNPEEPDHLLRFEYDRKSVYEEDSGTARVLDCLIPESELIDEDQRLFQVQHLQTELAWYSMHFEIRRVIEAMRTDDFYTGVTLMERIYLLADQPYQCQRMMVNSLTQYSLLRMRAQLPKGATGFDSPGMRNLKLVAKALWTEFEETLARYEHTPVSLAMLRMETERVGQMPDRLAMLAALYDGIHRLDVKIMEWKQLHLRMVWGHLGGAFAHLEESRQLAQHGSESGQYGMPTSLRGRPITDLQRITVSPMFPALWKVPDAIYHEVKKREGQDLY
jgi:tryptophan 2,3-dioxygenase